MTSRLPEEDGVFSGFHADSQTYDHASWNYQGAGGPAAGMPENVTTIRRLKIRAACINC